MTKGDECQLSWDDVIEIPPDFYAKQKAGHGNVQWDVPGKPVDASMPPPGPKQKKPKVDTTSPSTSATASAGAGVSPALDSEADEVSSSVDEKGRAASAKMKGPIEEMQGVWCEEFFSSIVSLNMEEASMFAHNPLTWHKACKDMESKAEKNPFGLLFARMLIYNQTIMALSNNHLHVELYDLAPTSPPTIVNRISLLGLKFIEPSRTDTKVFNDDCLRTAEQLASVGYLRVGVLVMANRSTPGGGVVKGSGAQEEDIFRRTDVSRHTDTYLTKTRYPLNMEEPTAMIIKDVTILRGACDVGYPFLEIRPKITSISMAAQSQPALVRDGTEGLVYGRTRIKVMLQSAKISGCDAMVLSAFGCGAFRHPPAEVATIFRQEIEKAGAGLPVIIFAISDDHNTGLEHNPDGNFKVFYENLDQSGDDLNLKAPVSTASYDAPGTGNLGTAQTGNSTEAQMQEESVRTEGPDAFVASGPGVQGAARSQGAGG